VPDLAEWDEGAVMVGFCEALRSLGYEADARILHAYEHGVPQHRSRLFIVGVRQGHRFRWPKRDETRPTLWDAIGDLPELPGGNRNDRLPYGGPASELQRRLRKGVSRTERDWIHDHITREVRADDLEAFRALPEGGTYTDVPEHLRRYRSDIFTDKYKRLSRSELSRTITAHIARDGYWYIHPLQHRTLSIREAARIQTFPDWFRFAGEPSHRFRQVGNAVPVLMAEALGRALVESITTHSQSKRGSVPTLRSDLVEWHQENARPYPWRKRALPWHVLLAELCLHRAQADHAIVAYSVLTKIAPSPAALIANEQDVRSTMEAHGLHWREGHLVKVARRLVDEFDGKVPASRDELLTLPGVGDYVANAVLCFGFGKPSILMDTNTGRIVSRLDGSSRGSRRWQLRLDLYRLAGPAGANAEFNSALLDLGAMICTVTSPRCLACPVARHCQTFRSLDS
jgi:DNA (cytosine-5)-methyltransferase 1